MSTTDKLIDALTMPKSAVDAMAKAVPDDVVKAIVGDNCGRRWAPTPPKPAEPKEPEPLLFRRDPAMAPDQVRVVTSELDWWSEREEPLNEWEYNPFSNARIRNY
jgi:hypothetical protein